jgi:phosphate transport system protein
VLEQKVIKLKEELVQYASLVETMIDRSMQGLIQKDTPLLTSLIHELEPQANDFEMTIDEQCVTLIAQYQPKAKDLRTILMISRMGNDLERVADNAVNISESALFLIERPQVKTLADTVEMAQKTIGMLKDSIDAFTNEDAKLAKNICERDSIVDRLRDKIIRDLIACMTSDSLVIERALHLIRISNNLERIADLSTNVCEDVIFVVQGRVIKHHKYKNSLTPEKERAQ